MLIGSHVSIKGGLLGAAEEAASYGANTFMIYTGAPQNTIRKSIDKLKIEEGKKFMEENNMDIEKIVVHAPYIINLASPKPETYQLAVDFLKKEMDRTEAIGAKYLVLHPGSFTESSLEEGIIKIAEGLNKVLTKDTALTICLETMAGKGSEVGKNFHELKQIIDKVTLKDKMGVCFDTCHTHDSGYDIVHDFDNVIKLFDEVIGIDYLKVFHINGSLNKMGAKKDRHANVGAKEGNPKGVDQIGFEALYYITHHEATKNKIFILETPWLDAKTNLYKEEILALRGGKHEI